MPVTLLEEIKLLGAPVKVFTGLVLCIRRKLLLDIGVGIAKVSNAQVFE